MRDLILVFAHSIFAKLYPRIHVYFIFKLIYSVFLIIDTLNRIYTKQRAIRGESIRKVAIASESNYVETNHSRSVFIISSFFTHDAIQLSTKRYNKD